MKMNLFQILRWDQKNDGGGKMVRIPEVVGILVALSLAIFFSGGETWSGEAKGSPEKGKILYNKLRCYYCHRIGNEGGNTGPDLTKEGAKKRGIEWQIRNLNDPASTHPTKHPDPRMPKFDKLTDKMLVDLASYLESLR